MRNLYPIIDWLSFTFPSEMLPEADLCEKVRLEIASAMDAGNFAIVETIFDDGKPCIITKLKVIPNSKGFLGFTYSADIVASRTGPEVKPGEEWADDIKLGKLAWGGTSQRGRAFVSLSGIGANTLNRFMVKPMLESLKARLTRLDIAVDDFDGSIPVESVVKAYRDGSFVNTAGRPPKAKFIDDLGNQTGKTLYVGQRESGKMLRVYEKGLQLQDKRSKWVRFEVEFHNTDRDIPTDVCDTLEDYFIGAYGYLDTVFKSRIKPFNSEPQPAKLKCNREKSNLTAYAFMDHLKRQYGKYFFLFGKLDIVASDFMHAVSRVGLPKRFSTDQFNDLQLAINFNLRESFA